MIPTLVMMPWHQCQDARYVSNIIPIIYIGHISKLDNSYQITNYFVSVYTSNYTVALILVIMVWHWPCGSHNDGDVMLTIYIDHTSKLDKWLSTDSPLFKQCQQLCDDADTSNDTVVPTMMMMSWWMAI